MEGWRDGRMEGWLRYGWIGSDRWVDERVKCTEFMGFAGHGRASLSRFVVVVRKCVLMFLGSGCGGGGER